ncbi:MAG: hypothetical protein WDA42_00790 [Candidatus Bathyarchaeia archaeon]
MKTLVAFAKWADSGDVIAILPQEPTSEFDASLCYSYEHVGQSGSLRDTVYAQEMLPAAKNEYADLLNEMYKLGYLIPDETEIVPATPDLITKHHWFRYARIWQLKRELNKTVLVL